MGNRILAALAVLFQKDRGKTASAARGMVDLNRLFQKDRGKTASAERGMVELNRLSQKDRGKTASAARILSPNPKQQPLPCLLIKSFFYVFLTQPTLLDLHALLAQGQKNSQIYIRK